LLLSLSLSIFTLKFLNSLFGLALEVFLSNSKKNQKLKFNKRRKKKGLSDQLILIMMIIAVVVEVDGCFMFLFETK